jgi:glycosyltransferase involved in cell wall biosynthesis
MKVLMLGWEFPPFISGGLGTACYGLTKAMSELGVEVIFVLPKPVQSEFATHVKMVAPKPGSTYAAVPSETFLLKEFRNVRFHTLPSALQPYQTQVEYEESLQKVKSVEQKIELEKIPAGTPTPKSAQNNGQQPTPQASKPTETFVGAGANYEGDMYTEVERYARLVSQLASQEEFDVIHAHDWMTYPAGLAIAAISGKPLVVHVHSTEFDRSGEHVNQKIYDIERQGMHGATRVITVSYLTKKIVTTRYNVPSDKIRVVYNAIDTINSSKHLQPETDIDKDEKIVLFLGRITMQKGPEYFLAAAKKVLEVIDNVRFVMAGSGDMIRKVIELAAEMGIGHKVLFTGFLRGEDVEKIYRMADLYVMPSVSEPFGIAPLEAISHDVPVIVSKQSGVSEILQHVLKVDFWDVNEMANKIIAVLKHPPLHTTLREHGSFEVRKLSWSDAARTCTEVYNELVTPSHVMA